MKRNIPTEYYYVFSCEINRLLHTSIILAKRMGTRETGKLIGFASGEKHMILYKFKSMEHLEHLADILIKERLYCTPYYRLNDPFEGLFLHAMRFPADSVFPKPTKFLTLTSLDDVIGAEDYVEIRVCSLSASINDVRLWSHYAGGHRGVAIEIETDGVGVEFHEVKYPPKLQVFDDPRYAGPSIQAALTSKTIHWQHEDEYRVITTESFVPIEGHIRRVILGTRCKVTDKEIVRRLVQGRIDVRQSHLDADAVEIRLD